MIIKSYLIEEDIKRLDKNLILFFGENLGLKIDFKNSFKNNYLDCEFLNFYQEQILKDINIFYNEINNISLFNKEKIIFIEQANDKIIDLIEEILPRNYKIKIVLFAELLEKKSKLRNMFEKSKECAAIACYADNEITMRNLIFRKLKGFEGLSQYNINLILENSNFDRSKLNNEVDKIVSCFEDKKISTEKLEKLLNTRENDNFNILKDMAFNGNKSQTNKLLSDTVIESEKNIFYLNVINLRLNKLNEIRKLSKNNNLQVAVNAIKPPIFWKDKDNFLKQAKIWDNKKINEILDKTYNLEIDFKSNSSLNKNILIKELIVDICKIANS